MDAQRNFLNVGAKRKSDNIQAYINAIEVTKDGEQSEEKNLLDRRVEIGSDGNRQTVTLREILSKGTKLFYGSLFAPTSLRRAEKTFGQSSPCISKAKN